MNKKRLTEILAQQAKMETKDAGVAVDLLVSIITTSISNGIPVRIRGFGTFTMRERKPRRVRSNFTGKAHTTQGALTPYFRPSPSLRQPYGKG